LTTTAGNADYYKAWRDQQHGYKARASLAARDIGPIPAIASVERRESCRQSLRTFCETYGGSAFYLGWSLDHLKMMSRIEESVFQGALFAFAMPRGSGKTTICRLAALWALSYAHRRFVFLIGATSSKADEALDSIRSIIRSNPIYGADFPEIAFPVQAIQGIGQRATGQLCLGESTLIEWSGQITLPTVPPPPNWPELWPLRADGKVPTSGAVMKTSGLTGEGIRGSLITLATGEMVRTDFVLLDDPQTPESARSKSQNFTRLSLISADVLGMAGPGKRIAAVMPCTVIEPDDAVDQILDRTKHPLWRGERTAMLTTMPTNLAAWDVYFQVYSRCAQLEPPSYEESNAYYIANRDKLDEGAVASWPDRFDPTEVSAIQSAMHLYFRDPRSFWAEYQNKPIPSHGVSVFEELKEHEIERKYSGTKRQYCPNETTRLTAAIDVGSRVCWYSVVAWDENFGGTVVDYGPWPGQYRQYFTAADVRPALPDLPEFRGYDETAIVYAALGQMVEYFTSRDYPRIGGGDMVLDRILIDSGKWTETVYQFCRSSPHKLILSPSKGFGITATGRPISEWARKDGQRLGDNWRIQTEQKARVVSFDTNHWKSFLVRRLKTPLGSRGCLRLFGEPGVDHSLYADHLTSEYRTEASGRGRVVEEWKIRPDRVDNHYWDTLVMAAVAASVSGLVWSPLLAVEGVQRRQTVAEMLERKKQTRRG